VSGIGWLRHKECPSLPGKVSVSGNLKGIAFWKHFRFSILFSPAVTPNHRIFVQVLEIRFGFIK
jgi:hypothetical protein